MVWNEVLDEDILLPAMTDWAHTCPTTCKFVTRSQVALQTLEAARAEAARGHCGTLNQLLAQMTLERWG